MKINLFAVLAVTVFTFILHILWYSKILFANLFIKNIGFDLLSKGSWMILKPTYHKSFYGSSSLIFIYEVVAAFITNYVLASIIFLLNAADFWRGFQLGIIVWIGFVAMPQLSTVTFEKRNFTIYLIHITNRLVALSISGGILAIWK